MIGTTQDTEKQRGQEAGPWQTACGLGRDDLHPKKALRLSDWAGSPGSFPVETVVPRAERQGRWWLHPQHHPAAQAPSPVLEAAPAPGRGCCEIPHAAMTQGCS